MESTKLLNVNCRRQVSRAANALILMFLASALLHVAAASEVQVSAPYLMQKTPAKNREYDNVRKKWKEVEAWKYNFGFHIKNVSEKTITVATGNFSQQTTPGDPNQEIRLSMNELKLVDGSLIIPPREDLRLVELRPSEAAVMTATTTVSVPLQTVKVVYEPKDYYGGRFGYWTGRAVGELLSLKQ